MLKLAIDGRLERRGHSESLVSLLLSAWALKTKSGKRWVTNEELRITLVKGSDEFRRQILWRAERWAAEREEEWQKNLLPILRDVWPKQLACKSPQMTARLVELAFASKRNFPKMVDLLLPLTVRLEGQDVRVPSLRRSKNNIADRHPEKVLELLHKVLPINKQRWPYGVDKTIGRLIVAQPSLQYDRRYIELMEI